MQEILNVFSNSPQDTKKIARDFARQLNGGEVLAFRGGLGMGKTCFTSGLAEGLDFKGDVCSPTFAIVNEYRGGRLSLFHFDMYRITSWEDLHSTGFFDFLEYEGVIAVEWSENIENALPTDTYFIEITACGDKRNITICKGRD